MHSVAAQRPSFSKRDSFTKRFSFPKRQSFPKSDVRPPPGAVSQRIDFKTESLESHLDSFRSEHSGPIRRVDSFRRKSWQRANYLCNPDLPERDLYSPATTVSGWSSTETDCASSHHEGSPEAAEPSARESTATPETSNTDPLVQERLERARQAQRAQLDDCKSDGDGETRKDGASPSDGMGLERLALLRAEEAAAEVEEDTADDEETAPASIDKPPSPPSRKTRRSSKESSSSDGEQKEHPSPPLLADCSSPLRAIGESSADDPALTPPLRQPSPTRASTTASQASSSPPLELLERLPPELLERFASMGHQERFATMLTMTPMEHRHLHEHIMTTHHHHHHQHSPVQVVQTHVAPAAAPPPPPPRSSKKQLVAMPLVSEAAVVEEAEERMTTKRKRGLALLLLNFGLLALAMAIAFNPTPPEGHHNLIVSPHQGRQAVPSPTIRAWERAVVRPNFNHGGQMVIVPNLIV